MILLLLVFYTFSLNSAEKVCENVYPVGLDVGMYWAGISEETYEIELEKSCSDEDNYNISKYFDPNKETVIFIHGAQPEAVEQGYERAGFDEGWAYLIDLWLSKAYNFGFYLWTQFADEHLKNFERAQAKSWSATYFANMQYKYKKCNDCKKVFVGEASINRDVTEILVDEIMNHGVKNIHLVGHSLGTQPALRAAYMLLEKGYNHVVRVTLLDPVFSDSQVGFFTGENRGKTIGDVMGEYIRILVESNVAVETYTSSKIDRCIGSVNENPSIMKHSAFSHVLFNQWGEEDYVDCSGQYLFDSPNKVKEKIESSTKQVVNRHKSIVPFYFMSKDTPPFRCHMEVINSVHPVCIRDESLALSASMSNADVLLWSNRTDAKTGEKLCMTEYDDKDRSIFGSTMTLNPGVKLFKVVSSNKMRM